MSLFRYFCGRWHFMVSVYLMLHVSQAFAIEGYFVRPWISPVPGNFFRFVHSFAGTEYTVSSTTLISRPSRGTYAFDFVSKLRFRQGTLLRSEGGIKIFELDLEPVANGVIPRTPSAAGIFWQGRECGVSDWRVDVFRDISGRTCDNLKDLAGGSWEPGVKTFTIMGVQQERIYLGDEMADSNFDGSAPNKRPQKLALDSPFSRVSSP